jgi:uncharacterized protein (DUF1330 family)
LSVYALALITIEEREAYERYAARFLDVLRPFGGRLLAADEAPLAIEGDPCFEKVVLVEFNDEQAFRRWFDSPAYREIAKDRRAGSTGAILLVHAPPRRGEGR